jgi:hypothetical protein
MSRSLGNVIGDSLQLSLGYAERLLKDVTADQFGRLAAVGEQRIESNHGAFIYGHLSLYAPRILEQLGQSTLQIPEGFDEVFSKDASCQDDPEGTIYPAMDQVTQFFFDGYNAALEALRAADDAVLQQPNPAGGRMTELFPTMGSMQNFYVGGHMMLHMGQMSAWRRMLGLGPA